MKNKQTEALLLNLISDIIIEEIESPRLQSVSISEVSLNGDGSMAKVYVTFATEIKKSMEELNKASSFIRRSLASRFDGRHTPQLTFIEDTLIDDINKLNRKLEEIK